MIVGIILLDLLKPYILDLILLDSQLLDFTDCSLIVCLIEGPLFL